MINLHDIILTVDLQHGLGLLAVGQDTDVAFHVVLARVRDDAPVDVAVVDELDAVALRQLRAVLHPLDVDVGFGQLA